MRKTGFLLTLFALALFAGDAYAQRGGGGGGRGGGGPRGGGGGGQQMGQQMGQGGGGQCQQGGGGRSMSGRTGGMMGMGATDTTTDTSEVVTQMLVQMDRNRDGVIATNEVPTQLQVRMASADANGDGMLNRLEQMAVIDRAKIMTGNPTANGIGLNAEIFRQLDRNRDNAVSRTEVPRQLQRMFRSLDTNGDGSIDAEEQAAILERITARLNPERKPLTQKPAL